jgi:hypothetical protein
MAVILINPFEVPKGKEDEALAFLGQGSELHEEAAGVYLDSVA